MFDQKTLEELQGYLDAEEKATEEARLDREKFNSRAKELGVPVVSVNSTDHDRALPTGDYFLFTGRSKEEVKGVWFSASSRGVEVHLPDNSVVDFDNWDPKAELIPMEMS